MNAQDYQNELAALIQSKHQELEIIVEWAAFSKLGYQYSPRVDIAVGPFSVISGENKIEEYDQLLTSIEINNFLKKIYDCHFINIGDEYLNEIEVPSFDILIKKNRNARCFIAIEIENSSSKKHIMGSIINATSLGRIGIGVAYNDSVKRTFLRILNYLAFLKRVEKNSYDTTNFLILTKEQFIQVCC